MFCSGSVTCYGSKVENANCPKDQYMVVKIAFYRGLSNAKTCGLSDDYRCNIDVTSLLKTQCDGQNECQITVDDNLFLDGPCSGLKKYLYFEYRCFSKNFKDVCGKCHVFVSLLYSYATITISFISLIKNMPT